MKKLIVWDEEIEAKFNQFVADRIAREMSNFDMAKECFDYFEKERRDIGIKDISNKPIYADSSIVEFSLGLYSKRKKGIGYFTWNDVFLRYEISVLNNIDAKCEALLEFNPFLQGNFKIIDTIQANDLRLIKE